MRKMCLWLEIEDDGSYDAALVKMALTCEDVIFCLLEVLKYGTKELACHASSVLVKVISCQKEKTNEGLLCLIWDTLPSILAEYCSENSHMKDHNITYYLKTTCSGIPSIPTSKIPLQCGTHIVKVLSHFEKVENMCGSRGPAIQVALMSLLMAMKNKDLRVLLNYANQPDFMKIVYHTSGYPNVKLVRPSLQLLMLVNKFYKEAPSDSQKKGYTLHVDVLHILYLLVQEDYDILICTLSFLYDVMTSEQPRPIMVIVSRDLRCISLPFLQILFRHLQNICSKNIPNVSRNGFKAMGALLQYAFKMHPGNELYSNLATHPWTHVVIRIVCQNKNLDLSCELLFFLCWWFHFHVLKTCMQNEILSSNIRTRRRRSRAPYPDLLSETAERVAKVLVNVDELTNPRINKLALVVMHRILLLDATISQEMIEVLRRKLAEGHFEISMKGLQMF